MAYSARHPGERSRAVVFSTRLVRPLAVCSLPVMIVALIVILEGYPALLIMVVGSALALVVSAGWTLVQMRREVVEIHIQSGAVSARSLHGASHPIEPLMWYRLLDMRTEPDRIHITLGYDPYRIERKNWPDFARLSDELASVSEATARQRDL